MRAAVTQAHEQNARLASQSPRERNIVQKRRRFSHQLLPETPI
jgi:hypothetical protein